MSKIKEAYLLWHVRYLKLPRTHRYTFGCKIDSIFIEIIEAVAAATFLLSPEKHVYVRLAIKKLDTLKILIMILWESGSLDNEQYIAISVRLEKIGRDLGGWSGQIEKKNSPTKKAGEK